MLPNDDLDFILKKVAQDWEPLRDKNLFITGGTGFFGVWLLESFAFANDALSLNAKAHVLTRDPAAFARKCPHLACRSEIIYHTGEIEKFNFPSGNFPFVIHAATDTSARSASSSCFRSFESIVHGTRRLLSFAAESKTKRILYISSGAVYGTQPPDLCRVSESYHGAPDPLLESSYYGEAKRASEWLCASHAREHGYEMVSARCFAFVGPHLPLDGPYAIGNFIRDALSGAIPSMAGDGSAHRSYLYAADLAVWLWSLLFSGHPNRAYNVGSDHSISIRELASLVAHTAGLPVPEHASPIAAYSRYVPDISLARAELALDCWTPLPLAIHKTMQWLISQNCTPASQ